MSLYDTISSHVNAAKMQTFTTMPAQVLRVYEQFGSTVIDCALGVRYMTKDGLVTEDAPLTGIPLVWPSAAGCYITFPISEGDTVMLHFAMRDCDQWKSGDGGIKDPLTRRSHNLSDAFAMPSMLPYGKAPVVDSEAVKIASTGTEIRILKDGTIELGEGAVERLLKGDSFLNQFLAHTHTYIPVSGTPTLTTPVTTVANTPDTITLWESTLSEVSKTL